MKRILIAFSAFLLATASFAQSPGDTLVVSSFNYSQTYSINQWSPGIRDTMIDFPNDPNLSFEKVLMLYNMRCKGGNVSTSTNRDLGCGEWDISCNTYITDSTRADSTKASHPSHIISGFSGTSYDYTTNPVYNLKRFIQINTSSTSVISETQSTIGTGSLSLNEVLSADQHSSKSQYLFTASELSTAGVTAGDLDGLLLNALSSSSANFLRVRLKHTVASSLSASSVENTGFTEVYFKNTTFSNGSKRLQFHTPFNWDGTSNVLVEFSLSNFTQASVLQIEGDTALATLGLTNANNYHISTETGPGFSIPASNLSTINNEVTVSFWSKGNSGLSTTATFILRGSDAQGNRNLSMHLPWSNSNVYFDCGHNGSNYNRINKLATPQLLENEWTHWAFTKNASTGSMKIYANGVLWHSGTSKTHTISLDTLTIAGNYLGRLDELRIWDKELSQTEIQNWKDRNLDNSHPQYSSLVAYYPLNEGQGNATSNSINSQSTNFLNTASWHSERGIDLDRLFTETRERPNVTFLQGTYNLGLVNDTVYDSVLVSSNSVVEYQINSNSGTIQNDDVSVVSSNNYWLANYQYILDGNSGVRLDSIPINSDGAILVTSLPYYNRYPSKYEIMSFVTPYGVNLDLGPNGKTWTFDLTDYMPLLKGKKRMTLERGGQWMEDMDIKFLFIVGTPPRDVMSIDQLWRVESRGYSSILADEYYEPRNVLIPSNATSFKVRSSVSGHGQEGEFIPRNHFVNVNGGANEFTWQVWKECGENPVYPQGGTWIYDRAGWCPGMATDVQHFDITSFVTPGQTATIDYGVVSAAGTSNYIANNQLVSYGAINHNLDASVVDISGPTNKVEYARTNSICSNPSVIIKNTGSTDLTSLEIEYWVNNANSKQTFSWSGNLKFNETEEVVLPSPLELWDDISGLDNIFHVEIHNPNGGTDEYTFNNTYQTGFTIPDVVPGDFAIWFRSNAAANESSYRLLDASGNVLFSRANMANNTLYRDTFNLEVGCYQLEVLDTDDDGINFWANTDGNGSVLFRQIAGGVIKNLNPDFGGSIIYNFTVDAPLSYDELQNRISFQVYPNPAESHFIIEGEAVHLAGVKIYNAIGQQVQLQRQVETNKVRFETANLATGIYTLTLRLEGKTQSRKIIIE